MKTLKVKMPRLPKLTGTPGNVCAGLYSSIHSGTTNRHALLSNLFLDDNENKNPVIGAGKGGKHYGKTSAMGAMADNGIKRVRQKKKEITPYKPIPQMHELISLEEIQRKCGIRKSRY